MNSFWSVFLYVFWIFAFVAFLMILFTVLVDLFRDQSLSGWWKAVWVIFLVFVPGIALLVYLIARGRGMAERNLQRHATVPEDDSWGQHPTGRPPRPQTSSRRRRFSTRASSAAVSSTPCARRRWDSGIEPCSLIIRRAFRVAECTPRTPQPKLVE